MLDEKLIKELNNNYLLILLDTKYYLAFCISSSEIFSKTQI